MSVPLSDTRLTEIEFRFWRARDTGNLSMSQTDVGVLLEEVKRLRAVVEEHGREAIQYEADFDRLRADLQRIQRWATTTVHGSAAAEVLLLVRDLPAAPSA